MTVQENRLQVSEHPAVPPVERLAGLDSLRAYAASAIIVFHMVRMPHVEAPPGFALIINNYFGFGVPLFFVVSAFSLTFGYVERLNTRADIGAFYTRRFARIAPLFYFMLVFQLLCIFFKLGMTRSVDEVVASLTFTFNFIPRYVDGIVPASWSIGVEMVFYFVFPAIMVLARNAIGSICALILALFVAAQSYLDFTAAKDHLNENFIYHGFLSAVPYFAFGVLFYHFFAFVRRAAASRPKLVRGCWAWALTATGASLVVFLILCSPLYLYFWKFGLRVLWDSAWSIPFGLICVGLALQPIWLLSNRVTRYLGKISFSLYLIHPTIVYYLGEMGVYAAIYQTITFSRLAAFFASLAVTMLIVAGVSSLTYRWIELPGMQLGKKVLNRRRPTTLRVTAW
jgi:peptidoglycan/LPS O-acetylase OafA/YrhL